MKMRQIIMAIALSGLCLGISSCHTGSKTAPKISIFCDHIVTIAHQEGISFAEAAALVKEAGYTGADVRVFQKPEDIAALDSLGFGHACAISDIDYSKGDQKELEDKTLAFMKERGYDRLLLVTGLMPEGISQDEIEAIRLRVATFASRVAGEGYTIMVEDYDHKRSLCYNAEMLDTLFTVSKDLRLVFDTGNFVYAGQDALEQLDHFRDKIGHVHLKDRASETDMTSVPSCTGVVPIATIIRRLIESGYDGWLTFEQFGSKNMLEDCKVSCGNISAVLSPES